MTEPKTFPVADDYDQLLCSNICVHLKTFGSLTVVCCTSCRNSKRALKDLPYEATQNSAKDLFSTAVKEDEDNLHP